MIRALLEILFTIFVVWVARAVLTSIFRELSSAASAEGRARTQPSAAKPELRSNHLHRDPVCGTYVSETARFQRQSNGQTFYYCSEECREKHSLVAR